MIGGVVLAAGAGRRYGGAKQLAELHGRPLLEQVLDAMSRAPLDRVLLVLGAEAERILAGVDLRGAEPVVCPDWEEGLAASLRAGIGALADAEAAVVVLGDQPLLSPEAVARVVAARAPGADAVRATYGGEPGHPVLLERSTFDAVARLRGDEGARALIGRIAVRDVPCDGLGRPDDVDTREQLEALKP